MRTWFDRCSSAQLSSRWIVAALALIGGCANAREEGPVGVTRQEHALEQNVALEESQVVDCGGSAVVPVVWLSLSNWPGADDVPPMIAPRATISLGVRNELDVAGTVAIHGRAVSQRGASAAVLHQMRLEAREQTTVEVALDALQLPDGGLDLLGHIVFAAVFDAADVHDVSDPLTVYFRPVQGGVEILDRSMRDAQVPDGAVTERGTTMVAEALAASEAKRAAGEPVPSMEGQPIGFAFALPADAARDPEGEPDEVAFDGAGGGR
jgi:hypothetical protein